MEKPISQQSMEQAFKLLDKGLDRSTTFILGGGGCMIWAHGYPIATADVDALPLHISFAEIDDLVKEIGAKLNLPGDWLNPYFSSFTFVLPSDYRSRCLTVFKGKHLVVEALGRQEMLLMKCFAHRPKDLGHARALLKAGVDVKAVEARIEELKGKGIEEADAALDFLDDLLEELE